MLKIVLTLLLVSTTMHAQESVEHITTANEKRWEEAFALRAKVMEEKFGFKFDIGWRPRVTISIPDLSQLESKTTFISQYLPKDQFFQVTPEYAGEIDFSIIDHELGHALVDQIGRRTGNGALPEFAKLEKSKKEGMRIIAEGMATYFGYESMPSYQKNIGIGPELFPEGLRDVRWEMLAYRYNGGRWLVKPIIDRFGEQGIVYLLTHPLDFKDGQVRIAALEYQHTALIYLKQQESQKSPAR